MTALSRQLGAYEQCLRRCVLFYLELKHYGIAFFSIQIFPKNAFEGLIKEYGLIIKLDYYGDIVKSYHDTDGSSITSVSEVYEDPNQKGVLYIGSYKNQFLGKLRLNSKQEL